MAKAVPTMGAVLVLQKLVLQLTREMTFPLGKGHFGLRFEAPEVACRKLAPVASSYQQVAPSCPQRYKLNGLVIISSVIF